MIDRLSGRVALLVVVVAALLVVLLGWFVLISPERSKADKLDSQIGATNTQLASLTSLLNGPVGRQSLISTRLFQKAVPNDPKESQILRELSSAASNSGVELDGISPGALVAGTGSETLPITLTIKGHYFAIQSFLRQLRTAADLHGSQVRANGRLYTVGSIQFTGGQSPSSTPGQASTGSSVIGATLALNAYVYSPTSTAVAPTVTTPTATSTSASSATP